MKIPRKKMQRFYDWMADEREEAEATIRTTASLGLRDYWRGRADALWSVMSAFEGEFPPKRDDR